MQAEVNVGRQRLKALQHELSCKEEAMLKAKRTQEDKKYADMSKVVSEVTTDTENHQLRKDEKPNTNNRSRTIRSRSMSSSTIKPVSEQDTAETKRPCVRRQSANLFEIEDVNSRNKSQTPPRRSSIGGGRPPRKAAEKNCILINRPSSNRCVILRSFTDIMYLLHIILQVRILSLMDEPMLDSIHELLKQKTYVKGSTIFFPNGPVEKMLFIVSGKMVSRGEDGNEVILSEGDACGEELVSWCLEQSPINEDAKKMRILGQRLVSNKLVSCITNVQTFSLRAVDIEVVISLY